MSQGAGVAMQNAPETIDALARIFGPFGLLPGLGILGVCGVLVAWIIKIMRNGKGNEKHHTSGGWDGGQAVEVRVALVDLKAMLVAVDKTLASLGALVAAATARSADVQNIVERIPSATLVASMMEAGRGTMREDTQRAMTAALETINQRADGQDARLELLEGMSSTILEHVSKVPAVRP